MEQTISFYTPKLADVYVGRHLSPTEQLVVSDIRFKFSTEMMIRAYVDAYYFMIEIQGDRNNANAFTLSGSTAIRRMLEMLVKIDMIQRDDAVKIYSICKYIGTDLNIDERRKDEWI